MPALNFTMFIDKIEDGRKTQTIRRMRKTPIKVGDRLHLFTGMRRSGCRRLSPQGGVVCTETHDFALTRWTDRIVRSGCDDESLENIALLDGFESQAEFVEFFVPRVGDNFMGQIIRWKWWGLYRFRQRLQLEKFVGVGHSNLHSGPC